MSITRGFEKNHDGNSYNTFTVDQLLAHASSLEAQNEELRTEIGRLKLCIDKTEKK